MNWRNLIGLAVAGIAGAITALGVVKITPREDHTTTAPAQTTPGELMNRQTTP